MTMIHITEEEIEVRPSPERGLVPIPLSTYYEEGYRPIEGATLEPVVTTDLLEQGIPDTVRLFQEYQGDPEQMAEVIQARAQAIHFDLKCNLIELGYLLYWANEFKLYTYLHYDSMKEWTENMGLNPDIRAHALALYRLWPDMRDLGYQPQQLVDGQITPTKAQFIAREIRDWKRQEKAQKKPKTPLDQEEREDFGDTGELPIVSADPPALAIVDTSVTDITAKINAIIESKDNDVLAEHNTRQGRPEAARLFIRNVHVNTSGLATATISFDAEEEQLRQLARGHAAFLFYFPGVDGSLSLQKPDEFDQIIDQLGGIIDERPRGRHSIADEDDL
jgi:hypothetical protein